MAWIGDPEGCDEPGRHGDPSVPYEIHYGMPLVAALVIVTVLAAYGYPTTVAVVGAGLAFIAGLLDEALAAHHPLAAKLIAQVLVAVVAVATVIVAVALGVVGGAIGASAHSCRRLPEGGVRPRVHGPGDPRPSPIGSQ